MTEVLTAAQMRAVEAEAIESGRVTGLELMERAGRGAVEAIFGEWPALAQAPHRAVVLCGPGNNGGDGFVVARLLAEQGWPVEVYLYGEPEKLPPDARKNYERWRGLGNVHRLEEGCEHPGDDADLFIDALFGIGLNRPANQFGLLFHGLWQRREASARAIAPRDGGPRVIAIDLPSGLCGDSGKGLKQKVFQGADDGAKAATHAAADLTVTFHRMKRGHVLSGGPHACGKIRVVDIGLEDRGMEDAVGLTAPIVGGLCKTEQHKYQSGHALILSGGPGKTGAARLAARGALRVGAGLVTIGCPRQALAEVASQVTAIMCRTLDGVPGLKEALDDKRLNALCLGPGMGLGPDTQAMVLAALGADRATVLDADALTRFERAPEVLFNALNPGCVLTPHEGEFGRLFPDIKEKLDADPTKGPAYSKVDATRAAAARAGCVVVFKGPDTVIAAPDGSCEINASLHERSAPWLATAGSGDVLAGIIAGLLARGFPAFDAACTGAWLHTECALSFGPGLIAEDLPEELPRVFRALGV